jgi:hypothetical protein
MGPFEVRALSVVCVTLVALGAMALLLIRGRRPAQNSQFETDVVERLQRIEQAMDTIAVEVERVSEGQRFVTKVIADRAAAQPSVQSSSKS